MKNTIPVVPLAFQGAKRLILLGLRHSIKEDPKNTKVAALYLTIIKNIV